MPPLSIDDSPLSCFFLRMTGRLSVQSKVIKRAIVYKRAYVLGLIRKVLATSAWLGNLVDHCAQPAFQSPGEKSQKKEEQFITATKRACASWAIQAEDGSVTNDGEWNHSSGHSRYGQSQYLPHKRLAQSPTTDTEKLAARSGGHWFVLSRSSNYAVYLMNTRF